MLYRFALIAELGDGATIGYLWTPFDLEKTRYEVSCLSRRREPVGNGLIFKLGVLKPAASLGNG